MSCAKSTPKEEGGGDKPEIALVQLPESRLLHQLNQYGLDYGQEACALQEECHFPPKNLLICS
jgi:hypothetical protein